jgi:hypothetical protein
MQIGQETRLIANQPLDIVYLLGKFWFHEKVKNNW